MSVNFIKFADDTNIFATGTSLTDIISITESEMVHVCEWLNNNKLSLNVSKTNCMILAARGKSINEERLIKINGQAIDY